MNLFAIELKAGAPIYEQVLYAARKAIISGELKPGAPFPSVREIASQLRVNPNTVQKALSALKSEGLIESHPGSGNRVCKRPEPSAGERSQLLQAELEALVLRARQLRLSLPQLVKTIENQWRKFTD